MGKRIISQARGKGGPRYRAPGFSYKGEAKNPTLQREGQTGVVVDLISCRGHSAPLAKVRYGDGMINLMIAAEGICVGDNVNSGPEVKAEKGNVVQLGSLPEGTIIFNIEKQPGDGGKFVRSSGTYARVLGKIKGKIIVELPSKKKKPFPPQCRANVGLVAGGGRPEKPLLKAGIAFYKHKAKNKLWPKTDGASMNAVDHPFGKASSHTKGRPTCAPRDAPAGRKVGKIRARLTGLRKGRSTGTKGSSGKKKKKIKGKGKKNTKETKT